MTMVQLGFVFVLEALKKGTDSNMFHFGIAALDRFKTRLKEYPQYCQHVTKIAHFRDFPPHIIQWLQAGTQGEMPLNRPTGQVLPPSLMMPSSTPGKPIPSVQSSLLSVPNSTVTTTSSIVRPH